MNQPDLTYIVSLHHRPEYLRVCLYALQMQTHTDFEVIVTDNTTDAKVARIQKDFVSSLRDPRFRYVRTAGKIEVRDCYWSSEYAMQRARGKWLCFPCEDTYYPKDWAQRMLTAAMKDNLDLALCENVIVGPDSHGADCYLPLRLGTSSFPGHKTTFIVRASKFPGWINKPTAAIFAGVDLATLQSLMADPKIRWGVVRGLWYFNN